ncbi:MAG TPA: hypothetical protein ENH84_00995 [Phycisphaerae bacterium]|nr:hypothetical protein [Phycisphaerae bacterium]
MHHRVIKADCLDWMREQPDNSVDLVFGSPPYENARTYGIDFDLKGEKWVAWMKTRVLEAVRICRGLVAFVIEGKTKNFRWSATPILLMADLHRAGVALRKPPIFHRVGIPGSGGPDWLRNDYEFIICCTSGGKLPWSENTAMGHPPKWAPGGEMSHRLSAGTRCNQWGGSETGDSNRRKDGTRDKKSRPSHHFGATKDGTVKGGHAQDICAIANPGNVIRERTDGKVQTRRKPNGERARDGLFYPPAIANPGNVVHCKVGGGQMGSKIAHENEAPFPESLAEFFVRSFCPPGGTVLDPFCGSGTVAAVCEQAYRDSIGIDIRQSQVDLTQQRIKEAKEKMGLFQSATPPEPPIITENHKRMEEALWGKQQTSNNTTEFSPLILGTDRV